MAELHFDPETGIQVLNETDVDTDTAFRAFADASPEYAALVRWTYDTKPSHAVRRGGLFERDRFVTPAGVFAQFKTAYDAAENDDVVSGILESSEAMTFTKTSIDCDDEDQADIWNQIAADIDLDSRLREMWREDFTISQFYVAQWWGTRNFKVRGKSEAGITRKKPFNNLKVPIGVSIMDPMKIVPVGNFMFNKETLAYAADRGEYDVIQAVINGDRKSDPVVTQLMLKPYEPDNAERRLLQEDGCPADRLFLLNPQNVWRHTSTRSQYQRFAPVRMKGIFELLDLKLQLRAMDRAHLIGGTNFIVLIKKGSDQMPAKPAEVDNLQAQVRTLARVPVLVGDHRLSIEIITPKNDHTLQPERYNGLDARITARLFQMFMTGNFAAGAKGDDSLKLAKIVAKGLEARRHMLRRSFEANLLKPTFNKNDAFTEMPKLRFHPKRIALDFDPTYANFILDLLDRGHISRESGLEEVDYDQQVELRRRRAEKKFDKDFEPRAAPGASNLGGPSADTKGAGRTGGRRAGGIKNGGGAAPGSGQGQAPRDPNNKSK
jgi:hypothetical protein